MGGEAPSSVSSMALVWPLTNSRRRGPPFHDEYGQKKCQAVCFSGRTYARQMPLTLSHPAAVLPLRRLGLPMTAMVIGSMVLDIPLYLGSRRGYDIAHSPLGVPTVDIVGALIVLAIWFSILRDPARRPRPGSDPESARPPRATDPSAVAARPRRGTDRRDHPCRVGLLHPLRPLGLGPRRLAATDHLGLAGLKWAQYVSGVLGLAVVLWFAIAHLRSLPLARHTSSGAGPDAVGTRRGVRPRRADGPGVRRVRRPLTGCTPWRSTGVVSSIIVFVVGGGLVCIAWQVARQRSPAAPVDEA